MTDIKDQSAMTIGQQAAPLATKGGRKPKRTVTPLEIKSVETVKGSTRTGASDLQTIQDATDLQTDAEFDTFAETVYASTDNQAEARAMILAARPALLDRLTAKKLAELQAQAPAPRDYAAELATNKAKNAERVADFFSVFED